MRFMMLMIPKGYETAEPGTMPPADAVAAMMKYNEALQKAGVLLAIGGLLAPAAVVAVLVGGGSLVMFVSGRTPGTVAATAPAPLELVAR